MTKLIDIAPGDVTSEERYRQDLGDITELAEDLSRRGLIQPISITPDHRLIAGGRRLAAALEAGLETIPAVVREGDTDLDLLELELVENLYRKEMHWSEEARLSAEIYRRHEEVTGKKTQRQSAKICGKSLANFARDIKLASAISAMPKLKECKTKSEALSVIDKTIYAHQARNNVDAARGADAVPEADAADGDQEETGAGEPDESAKDEAVRMFKRADANFRVGDAFEGLEGVANSSAFGFVEVDPPYGIDLGKQKAGKEGSRDHLMKDYNEVPEDEYKEFLTKTAHAVYSAAAPDAFVVFWFGWTWFHEVKESLLEAGFDVDDIPGVWVKAGEGGVATGQTQQPSYYLARSHEPFFIATKGRPRLRKEGRSNVFAYKPVPAGQKYHPTQRPIELMEELVNTFCYPGMSVLVPFLGSGATLLGAYRAGFSGMGWDLSETNKTGFLNQLLSDYED